ncbi:hypothetical protein [Catenuloplanes niger]|uniref:hypothetical protein n=1 Tax=Catenuloplanes niger TaxID=587534 RepID=UPI00286B5EEB|nr:hypothetical protein [Catenuloplanes niger]
MLLTLVVVGWLTFLAALFARPFGPWALVVPAGLVAVALIGQRLARRPWRITVTAELAAVHLAVGVVGLAASVLFLLLPYGREVMGAVPLVVLGLTTACTIALGLTGRREAARR